MRCPLQRWKRTNWYTHLLLLAVLWLCWLRKECYCILWLEEVQARSGSYLAWLTQVCFLFRANSERQNSKANPSDIGTDLYPRNAKNQKQFQNKSKITRRKRLPIDLRKQRKRLFSFRWKSRHPFLYGPESVNPTDRRYLRQIYALKKQRFRIWTFQIWLQHVILKVWPRSLPTFSLLRKFRPWLNRKKERVW